MFTTVGMVVAEGEGGPFDLINGLPVHPLVVHAAVVLIPLTAIGAIAMVIWPRFSRRHGWLVVAAAVIGLGFTFMATQSGEALESRVGEPGFDHAELGDAMPIFAGVLMLVVIGLWLIDRRGSDAAPNSRSGLRIVMAIVAVVVALANLFWVYRVGDSGAKSVWTGEVSASQVSSSSE